MSHRRAECYSRGQSSFTESLTNSLRRSCLPNHKYERYLCPKSHRFDYRPRRKSHRHSACDHLRDDDRDVAAGGEIKKRDKQRELRSADMRCLRSTPPPSSLREVHGSEEKPNITSAPLCPNSHCKTRQSAPCMILFLSQTSPICVLASLFNALSTHRPTTALSRHP